MVEAFFGLDYAFETENGAVDAGFGRGGGGRWF